MASLAATQADRRSVALRTLLLDAQAARAVDLLAKHAVPAILLKGRVTAEWLYPDELRNYGDVDLLVDPALRTRAMEVLASIGFVHWLAGADPSEYGANETELIGPHGVCIDLHHTLLGVGAAPARGWEVLSGCSEQMRVGGRTVMVLGAPARAMHLALHVAQNGPADPKAVADLERGLARLPLELWRKAEDVARSVDALDAFTAGLRVTDAGRDLAGRLDLAPPRNVELLLRTTSAPQEALQIQRLIEATSFARRIRLVGRKLWPTAAYMNGQVPAARGGWAALVTARLRRLAGLPTKFGVAFWSWSRARRAVVRARHLDVSPGKRKGHL